MSNEKTESLLPLIMVFSDIGCFLMFLMMIRMNNRSPVDHGLAFIYIGAFLVFYLLTLFNFVAGIIKLFARAMQGTRLIFWELASFGISLFATVIPAIFYFLV